MSSVGTRESLLSIIDDIELIAKYATSCLCSKQILFCYYSILIKFFCLFRKLFENLIAPKGQKLTSSELNQLAELLVLKDQELKSTLSIGNTNDSLFS